jgi:hypothetical protein
MRGDQGEERMTASYEAREHCAYPSRRALEEAFEAELRRNLPSVPPENEEATMRVLPGTDDCGEYGAPAA